jgi:hypothetical protein
MTQFSFGITRYVRLAIYPPVCIQCVYVHPSVSQDSLTHTVWLKNNTAVAKELTIGGNLSKTKLANLLVADAQNAGCRAGRGND